MKRDNRRSISVSDDFYARVRVEARKRGMSISGLITAVIETATTDPDPPVIEVSDVARTKLTRRCRVTGESIGDALDATIRTGLDELAWPSAPTRKIER